MWTDPATSQLLQDDQRHVWHPYTSMLHPLPVYPTASASGVRIRLADGRELIDGMSSWWAAIHGYNHPVLNQAMAEQAQAMSHVMFGGADPPARRGPGRLLAEITPGPLDKVFFCDSGSVSVEAAIKMALQYWHVRGKPEKARLLTVRGGYHGDTFGAMAVCDPVNGMHGLFTPVLPKHFFAPVPACGFHDAWDEVHIKEFTHLLSSNKDSIAAVILEPIVQGAGGVMVPLNERHFMLDLMKRLNYPVILTAGSGLGTINHTLLSLEQIARSGLEILGVVLNGPPNPSNRQAIEHYGKVRVLAEIPPLKEINPKALGDAFHRCFRE